ncbi:hypothetical protein GEMRC1_008015 [Eukaryota sp. GEM-RC1]
MFPDDCLSNLFETTEYTLNTYTNGDLSVQAWESIACCTDMDRTGTVLWTGTYPLISYIFSDCHDVFETGKTVVELGAGIALPSLFVAKYFSCKCLATDGEDEIVDLILRNADTNNLSLNAASLEWDECKAKEFVKEHGYFDVVIGAEILYDPCCYNPLLTTISVLLKDSSSTAIIAYKKRSEVGHRLLLEALDDCGLRYNMIAKENDCWIINLKK